MANTVYPLALQDFLAGAYDLATVNAKAMLVSSGYTYSATHHHVSDVPGGDIIQRASANLSSVTITSGVFDAANYTFGVANGDTPPSGDTIAAIIVYNDTPGTDATKQLVCFLDGLSLVTNGSDVQVTWNGSGICSI